MLKYLSLLLLLFIVVGCTPNQPNKGEELRQQLLDYQNRPKITSHIEVISIAGYNQEDKISNFEILIRLDAGSDDVQVSNMTINNARYRSTEQCEFDSITNDSFCIEVIKGNNNSILEYREFFMLKYIATDALNTRDEYRFLFSLNDKNISQVTVKAPESFSTSKVPLWPVG